jgi:hypothetical protein
MAGGGLLTYTDSNGVFVFESPYIMPNTGYVITVNGAQESLGVSADDPQWGQWAGWVYTGDNGYASRTIEISPSAEVNVPSAALFSNSQYATLRYGAESSSTFSHTVNFNVAIAGISTGYTSSLSVSYGFEVAPTFASYWRKPYYATTYYSDGYMSRWGIVSAGIAGEVPNWYWGSAPTQEYIDPNTLTQGYFDFPCANGTLNWYHYKETGSYTWSASSGVGFAISYRAFSLSIGVDVTVTVTSSAESWVTFEVDRRSEASPGIRMFRAYAPGWPLNPSKNSGEGIGGMELHIWEIGVG